jgi:two-component system OmpR family response regulator
MAHILLIEDDVGTASEIELELGGACHAVTHCLSIQAALTASRPPGIDLVIVDRQLPDGEGLDFIAGLRAEGNRTPALVLSALGSKLVDHSQKIMVAARATAEKKAVGQRS